MNVVFLWLFQQADSITAQVARGEVKIGDSDLEHDPPKTLVCLAVSIPTRMTHLFSRA